MFWKEQIESSDKNFLCIFLIQFVLRRTNWRKDPGRFKKNYYFLLVNHRIVETQLILFIKYARFIYKNSCGQSNKNSNRDWTWFSQNMHFVCKWFFSIISFNLLTISTSNELKIINYSLIRCDAKNRHTGGVCMYISCDVLVTVILNFEIDKCWFLATSSSSYDGFDFFFQAIPTCVIPQPNF